MSQKAEKREWTERDEIDAQITSVASERVTWEAAVSLTFEEAARCFRRRNDSAAQLLRSLADQFEARRKAASDRQQELLKKREVQS